MSPSRLKYEKPTLIDLQDGGARSARGACFPVGGSNVVSCGGGNHAGGSCFANGTQAGLSCSPMGSGASSNTCVVGPGRKP